MCYFFLLGWCRGVLGFYKWKGATQVGEKNRDSSLDQKDIDLYQITTYLLPPPSISVWNMQNVNRYNFHLRKMLAGIILFVLFVSLTTYQHLMDLYTFFF